MSGADESRSLWRQISSPGLDSSSQAEEEHVPGQCSATGCTECVSFTPHYYRPSSCLDCPHSIALHFPKEWRTEELPNGSFCYVHLETGEKIFARGADALASLARVKELARLRGTEAAPAIGHDLINDQVNLWSSLRNGEAEPNRAPTNFRQFEKRYYGPESEARTKESVSASSYRSRYSWTMNYDNESESKGSSRRLGFGDLRQDDKLGSMDKPVPDAALLAAAVPDVPSVVPSSALAALSIDLSRLATGTGGDLGGFVPDTPLRTPPGIVSPRQTSGVFNGQKLSRSESTGMGASDEINQSFSSGVGQETSGSRSSRNLSAPSHSVGAAAASKDSELSDDLDLDVSSNTMTLSMQVESVVSREEDVFSLFSAFLGAVSGDPLLIDLNDPIFAESITISVDNDVMLNTGTNPSNSNTSSTRSRVTPQVFQVQQPLEETLHLPRYLILTPFSLMCVSVHPSKKGVGVLRWERSLFTLSLVFSEPPVLTTLPKRKRMDIDSARFKNTVFNASESTLEPLGKPGVLGRLSGLFQSNARPKPSTESATSLSGSNIPSADGANLSLGVLLSFFPESPQSLAFLRTYRAGCRPISMSGWLNKRKRAAWRRFAPLGPLGWKRRYFCLRPTCILYFQEELEEADVAQFDVSSVRFGANGGVEAITRLELDEDEEDESGTSKSSKKKRKLTGIIPLTDWVEVSRVSNPAAIREREIENLNAEKSQVDLKGSSGGIGGSGLQLGSGDALETITSLLDSTDRPYAFVVRTAKTFHVFQASSETEANGWVRAIALNAQFSASLSQEPQTVLVNSHSEAQQLADALKVRQDMLKDAMSRGRTSFEPALIDLSASASGELLDLRKKGPLTVHSRSASATTSSGDGILSRPHSLFRVSHSSSRTDSPVGDSDFSAALAAALIPEAPRSSVETSTLVSLLESQIPPGDVAEAQDLLQAFGGELPEDILSQFHPGVALILLMRLSPHAAGSAFFLRLLDQARAMGLVTELSSSSPTITEKLGPKLEEKSFEGTVTAPEESARQSGLQEPQQRIRDSPLQWQYLDLEGVEQGPFPSTLMRDWLWRGFFRPSTPLRCCSSIPLHLRPTAPSASSTPTPLSEGELAESGSERRSSLVAGEIFDQEGKPLMFFPIAQLFPDPSLAFLAEGDSLWIKRYVRGGMFRGMIAPALELGFPKFAVLEAISRMEEANVEPDMGVLVDLVHELS